MALRLLLSAAPASANNPPNPPNYQFPADGSTNTFLQIFFYWFASDPDGDAVVGDLYLGTTTPLPLVRSNIEFPLVMSPGLDVSTTYRGTRQTRKLVLLK